MPKIKFSHDYPKLWGQKSVKLIYVGLLDGRTLPEELIEYDTKYSEPVILQPSGAKSKIFKYYPLPKTQLIQLVFLGDKGIPFCTLRRYEPKKYEYYSSLGKSKTFFDVVVEEQK